MARNPADPRGESAGIKSLPPCGERNFCKENMYFQIEDWSGTSAAGSAHFAAARRTKAASAPPLSLLGKNWAPSSMSCGSTATRTSGGRALCLHVWASVSDDLRQDD